MSLMRSVLQVPTSSYVQCRAGGGLGELGLLLSLRNLPGPGPSDKARLGHPGLCSGHSLTHLDLLPLCGRRAVRVCDTTNLHLSRLSCTPGSHQETQDQPQVLEKHGSTSWITPGTKNPQIFGGCWAPQGKRVHLTCRW